MLHVLFLILLLFQTSNAVPICFAHRGGGKPYFENSLSSVKAAIVNNLEGTEIDLRQTVDDQVVLIHDEDMSEVAEGDSCPLNRPIRELDLSTIKKYCRLKNGETVASIQEVLGILRESNIQIILDLKETMKGNGIKTILESGVDPVRFRLSAFYPEFLAPIKESKLLTQKQLETWNAIPRYEHFRHPVLSETRFRKSFHLFSAFTYGLLNNKNDRFSAWEVNYPFLLRIILPVGPEFIVTKAPEECMEIRDGK